MATPRNRNKDKRRNKGRKLVPLKLTDTERLQLLLLTERRARLQSNLSLFQQQAQNASHNLRIQSGAVQSYVAELNKRYGVDIQTIEDGDGLCKDAKGNAITIDEKRMRKARLKSVADAPDTPETPPEPVAPGDVNADNITIFCTECGEELATGVKFCAKCGAKAPVASDDSETDEPVDAATELTAVDDEDDEPYTCPKCNAEIEGDPKFCPECGFKLYDENENAPDDTGDATAEAPASGEPGGQPPK